MTSEQGLYPTACRLTLVSSPRRTNVQLSVHVKLDGSKASRPLRKRRLPLPMLRCPPHHTTPARARRRRRRRLRTITCISNHTHAHTHPLIPDFTDPADAGRRRVGAPSELDLTGWHVPIYRYALEWKVRLHVIDERSTLAVRHDTRSQRASRASETRLRIAGERGLETVSPTVAHRMPIGVAEDECWVVPPLFCLDLAFSMLPIADTYRPALRGDAALLSSSDTRHCGQTNQLP
ncbi:hypothetical protein LZ31DRAFT_88900 [Colletotrichum somersetense]|nr:hypothetical protein LZ31DRAFT_88900 [Colletotrichum somersetense]